ncbi:hypothetical protein ABFS83_13G177500 [Erythranthe nasuta]
MEEGKRVCALVVDDDRLSQRVHAALLRKYGILETEVVDNGKEAVDLFKSGKTFDLVIMDLEMPVMDGAKATCELREMGVTSMIVGVTACEVEAEKAEFMAAGLDACWDKPLSGSAIIAMLDELAKKLL